MRDILSDEVLYCFDDQDLDAQNMSLTTKRCTTPPVVNREKRLVGIISPRRCRSQLGDASTTGQTISRTSRNPAESIRRRRTEVQATRGAVATSALFAPLVCGHSSAGFCGGLDGSMFAVSDAFNAVASAARLRRPDRPLGCQSFAAAFEEVSANPSPESVSV